MKILVIILFTLLSTYSLNAQTEKLDSLRIKFSSEKKIISYKKNKALVLDLRNQPPPSPKKRKNKKNKLVKSFNISKDFRLTLFPFSNFDSIYLIKPNLFKNDNEPRNYLNAKYFSEKRLITTNEKEQLSNILFNYYYFQYYLEIGVISTYGCECTEKEYPKMILVFVKNGENKNFISFPNDVYLKTNSNDFKTYKRTNFNNDELNIFDLSPEKEKLILKIFNIN